MKRVVFLLLVVLMVVAVVGLLACKAEEVAPPAEEEEVAPPAEYSLKITVVGEGSTYPEPGTTTVTEGETVFIRAIPDEGYAFDHWEGDVSGTTSPVMVEMTSDMDVVAVFVEAEVVPEEVAGLPPIEFTIINAELGGIRLKGDDLEPYGIDAVPPIEAPWTITIPKGSTITVTIGVSGHPESGTHHLIIEGTDIDVTLGVGESIGTKELTFNEVGTFKVYSENLPPELECAIEVVEAAPEAAALPPISRFVLGDVNGGPPMYIRFEGDDLTPYGADFISPVSSADGPWTITIPQGSTITITEVYVSGRPGTVEHQLAIEGTDVEFPILGQREGVGPFEVTFNEAGTFRVYCKLHPDEHGECTIVVTPAEGEAAPEEEAAPEVAAPAIPHTLEGRDNCLGCHGESGFKPFPADHAGRTNDICTTCHQPAE